MWNHLFVILIAFTAGLSPGGQAPDLSGTWVATKDAPSGLAPPPAAPLGERFAIQQSGDTLTLTRSIRDTTVATAYVLDRLRELRVLRDFRVCAVGASHRDNGQSQPTGKRASE